MSFNYLNLIVTLIAKFIDHRYANDYDNMYKTLDSLESLISPKFDNDDVEENLKWIRDNIESHLLKDGRGKIIGIYPDKENILKEKLSTTFKLILAKLDKKEMLTKKELGVTEALSEME